MISGFLTYYPKLGQKFTSWVIDLHHSTVQDTSITLGTGRNISCLDVWEP